MSSFAGKIRVKEGKWTETCVLDSDLVANQAKYPAIRSMIEHVDQRSLATLLVSGSVGKYGVGHVDTKTGDLAVKGKDIGNNAYQFDVMGRIQQASVINAQIGASGSDGTFQLSLADNYIVPGMNVMFNGQGFQARCMALPTGSAGNYVYSFQSPDGTVFNWTTHVAGQGSVKTCFGGYTSYGEASLRGYGRSHFPDTYINHTTIQRKTQKISGTAASNVLWLEYEDKGVQVRGWMYTQIQQALAQSTIEDEIQKWFGVSDMKSSTGQLLTAPRLIDAETGNWITQGDGVFEQLAGGNELFGSGVNGEATEDDFEDMMSMLEKKSNGVKGLTHVCITGTDGYANAQKKMVNLAGNQNVQIHQNVTQTSQAGGAMVDIGFHYARFNINGNSIIFVKFPKFDDDQMFTAKGSDGKSLMSSTYVFLNTGGSGQETTSPNIEILNKGANGISRGNVAEYFNGMTGDPSKKAMTEEDAIKYAVLKEDLLMIYNTSSCGVIRKNS